MSKVAVIYWSGTGNTQQMAEAVAEGAKGAGAEVSVFSVSEISAADAAASRPPGAGLPAMGARCWRKASLNRSSAELEGSLSGKKVVLFGSYDWGDGQWMRDWQQRTVQAGAQMPADGLIVNLTPGRGRPHPVPRARRQDCGVRVCRIPASSTRLPGGGTLNLFLAQATTAAHSTLYPGEVETLSQPRVAER